MTDRLAPPTAKELFLSLPPERLERSTAKGVTIFLGATALWASFMAIAVFADDLALKVAASLTAGLWLAILFVVGHDACHGSLTPRPLLNRLLGRLAFVHSLHPYTSWKHSHNSLHHGWTNVRGKDIVFVPFSKKEYDRLPAWRRWVERRFRSPLGLPFFYFFTIWLPYEVFPNSERAPRGADQVRFQVDRLLVFGYLGLLVTGLWTAAGATGQSAVAMLAFGLVVPQIVFQIAMSFVSYVHHTHLRAPWYGSAEKYVYFNSQVRSTVHSEFPAPIEFVLHRILDHTAHHSDPRVPLYNLHMTQAALERLYPLEVIHEPWSLGSFLRTMRTCRLYDYENLRWLDWDGKPLTPPMLTHASA
ncbi:MAG: hypothetical protein AMXMBFR58_36260 [Phycisphaerae bacterium]